MQGPVGHFMDSGFYPKTKTEEQKAFNPENTMIRFMMGREQKWTWRRSISRFSSKVLQKHYLLSTALRALLQH